VSKAGVAQDTRLTDVTRSDWGRLQIAEVNASGRAHLGHPQSPKTRAAALRNLEKAWALKRAKRPRVGAKGARSPGVRAQQEAKRYVIDHGLLAVRTGRVVEMAEDPSEELAAVLGTRTLAASVS
jgi:hypothetical protein